MYTGTNLAAGFYTVCTHTAVLARTWYLSKEPRSTAVPGTSLKSRGLLQVIPRREPGMRVLDLVYEPGVHLSILERGPGAVGGELARLVFVPVAEGLWTD